MQQNIDSVAEQGHDKATGIAQPAARRPRLLAIDDEDSFRTMLKELLEPMGFEVHAFSNPVKALEFYTREKETFDLIIIDYYMPQLDGAKTYEWLKKLNPNARVIICSGAEELRLRQILAKHAIDGYIHKPFRMAEAEVVIRHVLSKPPKPVS